jgi:hypothetical protein
MQFERSPLTFRRNVSSTSSRSKSKLNNKPAGSRRKADSELGLLFDHGTICYSETSVNFQTTHRYNLEYHAVEIIHIISVQLLALGCNLI